MGPLEAALSRVDVILPSDDPAIALGLTGVDIRPRAQRGRVNHLRCGLTASKLVGTGRYRPVHADQRSLNPVDRRCIPCKPRHAQYQIEPRIEFDLDETLVHRYSLKGESNHPRFTRYLHLGPVGQEDCQ